MEYKGRGALASGGRHDVGRFCGQTPPLGNCRVRGDLDQASRSALQGDGGVFGHRHPYLLPSTAFALEGTVPTVQDAGRMLTEFLKHRLASHRNLILPHVLAIQGLMRLLMKVRNTGEPWTTEERREIRSHLLSITRFVPILILFLLPGGLLFLPVLAEVLDRRRVPRR